MITDIGAWTHVNNEEMPQVVYNFANGWTVSMVYRNLGLVAMAAWPTHNKRREAVELGSQEATPEELVTWLYDYATRPQAPVALPEG